MYGNMLENIKKMNMNFEVLKSLTIWVILANMNKCWPLQEQNVHSSLAFSSNACLFSIN